MGLRVCGGISLGDSCTYFGRKGEMHTRRTVEQRQKAETKPPIFHLVPKRGGLAETQPTTPHPRGQYNILASRFGEALGPASDTKSSPRA